MVGMCEKTVVMLSVGEPGKFQRDRFRYAEYRQRIAGSSNTIICRRAVSIRRAVRTFAAAAAIALQLFRINLAI